MVSPSSVRISITVFSEVLEVNRTNGISISGGAEAGFLKLLIEKLNFKPEFVQINFSEIPVNRFNSNADIAIGRLAMIESYSKSGFAFPYDFGSLHFLTRLPAEVPKFQVLSKPFEITTWLLLLLFLLLYPMCLYYLYGKKYKYAELLFNVVSQLLQQPGSIPVSARFKERIIDASWRICAFWLALYYTSLLLSFLMVPVQEQPINSIPRLYKAVTKRACKCMVFKGSGHGKILSLSGDREIKAIGEQIQSNNWEIDYSLSSLKKSILMNGDVVVVPSIIFKHHLLGQVLVSDEPLFSSYVAIYSNKNFCCRKILEKFVLRVTAGGIYHKLVNDYYYKQSILRRSSTKIEFEHEEIKKLTLYDLCGAFALLVSGYFLAFLIFNYEKSIQHKGCCRRNTRISDKTVIRHKENNLPIYCICSNKFAPRKKISSVYLRKIENIV